MDLEIVTPLSKRYKTVTNIVTGLHASSRYTCATLNRDGKVTRWLTIYLFPSSALEKNYVCFKTFNIWMQSDELCDLLAIVFCFSVHLCHWTWHQKKTKAKSSTANKKRSQSAIFGEFNYANFIVSVIV